MSPRGYALHRTTYEVIPLTAHKRVQCDYPGCGKWLRRQRTFTATLNPFNRNPDGTVRTRSEVWDTLKNEAADWQTRPAQCVSHPTNPHRPRP